MSEMAARAKGAELARKFGAPKTAEVIETGGCFPCIFATAIEEIGAPKVVEALAQEKNVGWACFALRDFHDLT
jgi:hypothetical protein